MFVSLIMTAFSYAFAMDTIKRNARAYMYNNMHTANDPNNIPDYASQGNYNYNQQKTYTPYLQMNSQYKDVYKNIYSGEIPPIPKQYPKYYPSNNIPRTKYPTQQTVQPVQSEQQAAEKAEAQNTQTKENEISSDET